MQPRRPRVATAKEVERKKREDDAILDLVRETLDKLNGLGDRLEAFVAQGENRGGR